MPSFSTARASSTRVRRRFWRREAARSRGYSRSILKVAIIDSGIHAAHPHVGGVIGGIGIREDGSTHDDFVDRLGHGTAVAAVIHEKAPQAELFIIKVFDRELAATGAALVSACRYALDIDAGLVNLSLGTQNQEHAPALLDA